MKDYKFSNGTIKISGFDIPYDIPYDKLKGLFGAHHEYDICIFNASLYDIECYRIIISLDYNLSIKKIYFDTNKPYGMLKRWLYLNLDKPNSSWTKNEETYDGDEEITWDEEGVKYYLIDFHDIEMELNCIWRRNEYAEDEIEFNIEYNRGVRYANDSRRHFTEN